MSNQQILMMIFVLAIVLVVMRTNLIGKFKEAKQRKQKEEEAQVERTARIERKKQAKKAEETYQEEHLTALRRDGLEIKTSVVYGQNIYFLHGGAKDAEEPPILLLHGFAADKEVWTKLAAILIKNKRQIIAPDLPGFGATTKDPNKPYDVTTQAKRLKGFVQKLGLGKKHIVGSSMGATIAAAYTYSSQEDVQSLTLIEPFCVGVPYKSKLDEMLEKDQNPLVLETPSDYEAREMFLYRSPPLISPELKRRKAQKDVEDRVFQLKVWREVREGERSHLLDLLLPEIKVRTMVVRGAESNVVHAATADLILQMMSNVKRLVVADSGHFPMVDQPQAMADGLLAFFRSS